MTRVAEAAAGHDAPVTDHVTLSTNASGCTPRRGGGVVRFAAAG